MLRRQICSRSHWMRREVGSHSPYFGPTAWKGAKKPKGCQGPQEPEGVLGLGNDLDGAGRGDVRADVHRVVVGPQGTDRRRQVDLAAIDLFTEGPGQRLRDVGVEDHLHRITYGSRATSRALFTAAATSRWCCEQVPVTLRARIFPRSETNRRSNATSLKST